VFSAIPAQNATGNWVKVVQRLPVRLNLIDVPKDLPISAGLSAHVVVDTRSEGVPLRGRG
jgi:membrane fusion protein (multidrug efflux system)